MVLASGVALAANVKGTGDADVLTGTETRDTINPFDGNDTVDALGGNDDVRHSFGDDTIYRGPGKDLIDCAYLETRASDIADTACATRGVDTVVDCETVIYSDPTDG